MPKKTKSPKISDTKINLSPENKKKYTMAAICFVAIAVAIFFLFIFQRTPSGPKKSQVDGELKDFSEITLKDRPYVTLTPTSDGAEIIVSLENISYFDSIEYEITYNADNPQSPGDKIQRGATGTDVNTKDQKYKKDILLGTASKGVKSPDRGITDGKLTLHLGKGDSQYLSETQWDLFEIGKQATTIKDQTGNLNLDIPATLGKTYWVILADTIGVPPTFDKDPQTVITPVYGAFSIAPKFSKSINLDLKLTKDSKSPSLNLYSPQEGKWETKEPKYDQSTKTISTSLDNFATFVVTSSE